MNDKQLLQLLKSNPNAGMNLLIGEYSGLVFTIVRGKLSGVCDSSEIEDCVTDVFLNFQSGLKSFEAKASVKNYIAVIAKNTAGMYLRNRLQTDSIDDDDDFLIYIPEENDFTEEYAEKQLLKSIHEFIRQMGPPDSVIIIRKYFFGQSSKQIAKDLRMTVSNVDVRTHRAIVKLRKEFGGES